MQRDENNKITVSKNKRQCYLDGKSFICDLKEIIYNFEDEKLGPYSVFYNNECNGPKSVEGRIIIIQRGLSLTSISPNIINKEIVDGSQLTLTYDDNMKNRTFFICLYSSQININECFQNNSNYIYSSQGGKIMKNEVTITLKNINCGLYHIYTYIFNSGIKIINENLSFKVYEQNIKFLFNHHFFVLNNDAETNKLIIRVNGTLDEFGCEIIENSEKESLYYKNSLNNG